MCDSTTLFPSKREDLHHTRWIIYTKNDAKEVKPIINTAKTHNPNIPNDSRDSDTDEEEDNGQSWHEMLDPELQPEQPIPDNQESLDIYADHSRLAKEYLRVETKLYFSQDLKGKVLQEMDPEERRQKEELLQKFKDREELLELYNNLKSSLLTTEDSNRSERDGPYGSDMVPDDSWVVINNNNNNNNNNQNP